VLINQLRSFKKEEEVIEEMWSYIHMCRSEIKHKTVENHNTNVITEFGNLAYVFGPCLGGLCLFLFETYKYIMIVPKCYKNELFVFYQIS
jgi:hypothetical protein